MIKYDPKDAVLCLPPGDYPATIDAVEEKQSKAGNDMYQVDFTVYTSGDKRVRVTDYIVIPSFVWKLKRLARALGMEDAFKAGSFDPASQVGQNIVVTLDVEEKEGYDDRNTIKAYLTKDGRDPKKPVADAADDLPF